MAKRFITGEKSIGMPANTLNEFADRIAALESIISQISGQLQQNRKYRWYLDVDAKNTDEADTDFREHEIVGIKTAALDWPALGDVTDPATGMILAMPAVEIEKYDKDKHGLPRSATTLAPIPHGKSGPIAFMGLIALRIDQKHKTDKAVAPKDATATHVESSTSGWDIWSRGNEAEEADEDNEGEQWGLVKMGGGSGGGGYQIVRGVTTAAVLSTDATFQITSLVPLEEGAIAPPTPLTLINIASLAHTDGETVYGILVADSAEGDWEELPTSAGTNTPPLREFILSAAKARGDGTATAYWLSEAGVIVGDPVSIDDATLGSRFAGQAASYIEGEEGFYGQALLMRDLAESPSADTWRMINCEGYARKIVASWYSSGVAHYVSNESTAEPWQRREPAAIGGDITIADPASLLPASPTVGLLLVCELFDPDTSPPTYDIVGVVGGTSSSNTRKGRCYAAIPAATGNLTAHWGTTGSVKLMDQGTGAVSGSATSVDNDTPISYVVDAMVFVDVSTTPPRVLYGTCGALSGFWE